MGSSLSVQGFDTDEPQLSRSGSSTRCCGLGIVLLVAVAWVYYRQALDAPARFGLGLIVAGIAVIHLFSKSLPH